MNTGNFFGSPRVIEKRGSQRGSMLVEAMLAVTMAAFLLNTFSTLRVETVNKMKTTLLKTHARMAARSAARIWTENPSLSASNMAEMLELTGTNFQVAGSTEEQGDYVFVRATCYGEEINEGGVSYAKK